MFDDHVPPAGNNNTPPPNLPMAEPEDMFSRVEEEPQVPAGPYDPAPVQSAGNDPTPGSAMQAGVLRPKEPTEPPVTPVAETAAARMFADQAPASQPADQWNGPHMGQTMAVDTGSSKSKIVAVVIVLIVVFLAGLGWVVYSKFFASGTETVTPGVPMEDTVPFPAETEPVPSATAPDAATPDTLASPDEIDDNLIFGQPVDQDGDGLDDAREEGIGTDPKNWDSDSDELSDGDEVIIWKTNPLNPDTDGDTFKDGAEVRAGYSPTGAGRLFEPPTSTKL